ncbi:hypothetical protein [Mucilaginibacter gilvus]|nr:hypothetical protein [Mucilaginibacter gilvus]
MWQKLEAFAMLYHELRCAKLAAANFLLNTKVILLQFIQFLFSTIPIKN